MPGRVGGTPALLSGETSPAQLKYGFFKNTPDSSKQVLEVLRCYTYSL